MTRNTRNTLALAALLALGGGLVSPAFAEAPRLRPGPPLYVDRDGTGLRDPEGVSCGTGRIAIADTGNGRIVFYSFDDKGIDPAGEVVVGSIPFPTQVQFAGDGRLWVLDGKSKRVARVSEEGASAVFVDLSGGDAGRNGLAKAIAVGPDGRLYVVDVANGRVAVIDPDGRFGGAIEFPPGLRFGTDVAVDAAGRVFVLDGVGRAIWVADSPGSAFRELGTELRDYARFPTAVAVDAGGNLLVADGTAGSIAVLDQSGTFRGQQSSRGVKAGFLRAPVDLCVSPDGRVFVADRDNNRVQPYRVR